MCIPLIIFLSEKFIISKTKDCTFYFSTTVCMSVCLSVCLPVCLPFSFPAILVCYFRVFLYMCYCCDALWSTCYYSYGEKNKITLIMIHLFYLFYFGQLDQRIFIKCYNRPFNRRKCSCLRIKAIYIYSI